MGMKVKCPHTFGCAVYLKGDITVLFTTINKCGQATLDSDDWCKCLARDTKIIRRVCMDCKCMFLRFE